MSLATRTQKNQDKQQTNDKKHQHQLHHNYVHHTSDNNELHASVDTPVLVEDQT